MTFMTDPPWASDGSLTRRVRGADHGWAAWSWRPALSQDVPTRAGAPLALGRDGTSRRRRSRPRCPWDARRVPGKEEL